MSDNSEELMRVRLAYRTLYTYNQRILGLVRQVASSFDCFRWSGMYVPYDEDDIIGEDWSPASQERCILSATPLLAAYFMFYKNQNGADGNQHTAGDELLSLQFTADAELNEIIEISEDGETEAHPIPTNLLASDATTSKAYARIALARCMTSCTGKTWFRVWDKIEFADHELEVSHWPSGAKSRYSLIYQDLPEEMAFDSASLLPAVAAFIDTARPILVRS